MTASDLTLIREKHAQLDALLPGLPAEAWVVFCREGSDRSTLLFAGQEMVGLSAFVFTRSGRKLALVAEAAPSLLGLGAQPPQISWGRMLSVRREAIRSAPHVKLCPGIAITTVVLGFGLLGDGVRDVVDRRLKDG